MASLSNDLEGLNLNLPDVVAEAAGLEPTTSVPSTPKKSVRNRRGRRGGANKKSTGSDVQIPAGTSAVKLEDLGACALVNDDQRVPNISLHNLEDFGNRKYIGGFFLCRQQFLDFQAEIFIF